MGADLTYENLREEGGEPVADLRARFSPEMTGIDVPRDAEGGVAYEALEDPNWHLTEIKRLMDET